MTADILPPGALPPAPLPMPLETAADPRIHATDIIYRNGHGLTITPENSADMRQPAEVQQTLGLPADSQVRLLSEMSLGEVPEDHPQGGAQGRDLWFVELGADTVVDGVTMEAGYYFFAPNRGEISYSTDPAQQRGFIHLQPGQSTVGRPSSPTEPAPISFPVNASRRHLTVDVAADGSGVHITDTSTFGTRIRRNEIWDTAPANAEAAAEVIAAEGSTEHHAGVTAVASVVEAAADAVAMPARPTAEVLADTASLAQAIESGDESAQHFVRAWLQRRQAQAVERVWDRLAETASVARGSGDLGWGAHELDSRLRRIPAVYGDLHHSVSRLHSRYDDWQEGQRRGFSSERVMLEVQGDLEAAQSSLRSAIGEGYTLFNEAFGSDGRQAMGEALRTIRTSLKLDGLTHDAEFATALDSPWRYSAQNLAQNHRQQAVGAERGSSLLGQMAEEFRDDSRSLAEIAEALEAGIPPEHGQRVGILNHVRNLADFLRDEERLAAGFTRAGRVDQAMTDLLTNSAQLEAELVAEMHTNLNASNDLIENLNASLRTVRELIDAADARAAGR